MKDFHFFASSARTWMTTNDKVDLRQLLRNMDKEGFGYNLFLVPCKHSENYEINWYQPQVVGSVWLGSYSSKRTKAQA
jgi:hypothetical protein